MKSLGAEVTIAKMLSGELQRRVRSVHGCACTHLGTVFVHEVVDNRLRNIAVEVFQLKGHSTASQAFIWDWDGDGHHDYCTVLREPPIDSPYEAVKAAMARRA